MSTKALNRVAVWSSMISVFCFTVVGLSETVLRLTNMPEWAALVIGALMALGIVSIIRNLR